MTKKNFEEFQLGSIFEKLNVKKAVKAELSKTPSKEYSIPVVYAKYGDNGIMYWGKKGSFTTYSNVISIVYNGVISAGKAYAQQRLTGILAESYLIRLKDYPDIPFEATFYIATIIEHTIYPKYSRENLATWNNKVENEYIKLPVKDGTTDQIDFDYMKEYVLSIHEKLFNQIDSFLNKYNLNKLDLTEEEKNVLSCKPKFHKFVMGDLFKKLSSPYKGKGRKQDNVSRIRTKEFSLALINCKNGDNGVMYYGRKDDFTVHKNVLSIIYNGPPTEGQTYYQEEIGLYTDAYIIDLKEMEIPNRQVGIYLATAINKSIHNLAKKKYSRGNKATWESKVENDEIYLPVDSNENIDWKYMEHFISALEKQSLKRVLSYKKLKRL